jgi:hypothetical protein
MSPARAILRVAGYEMTTAGLPEQVTQVCGKIEVNVPPPRQIAPPLTRKPTTAKGLVFRNRRLVLPKSATAGFHMDFPRGTRPILITALGGKR